MDRETVHAAQCSKSRALIKWIILIIEIHYFEHQSVLVKGLFQ